jgi:hypothetical protein
MKIQKIFITIAALSTLLIFAGCTTEPTTSNQADKTQTTGNLSITPGTSSQTKSPDGSIQIAPSQDAQQVAPKDVPQPKTLSAADQAAYSGAMQLKDATYCDKISDADYKTTCKTDLADATASNEALTKSDASLCDKLSTKDLQDACKIQVEVSQKAQQDSVTEQKQWGEQLSIYNDMLSKKDFTSCDKLTNPTLQKGCRESGLIAEALAAKDIKICDKGINETEQYDCRYSYKEISTIQQSHPSTVSP